MRRLLWLVPVAAVLLIAALLVALQPSPRPVANSEPHPGSAATATTAAPGSDAPSTPTLAVSSPPTSAATPTPTPVPTGQSLGRRPSPTGSQPVPPPQASSPTVPPVLTSRPGPGVVLQSFDAGRCSTSSWRASFAIDYIATNGSSLGAVNDAGLDGVGCAARIQLNPGDERLEFHGSPSQLDGQTRYYGVALRLDPTFPLSTDTVLFQFVNTDGGGTFAPPLQMTLQQGNLQFWNYSTPSGQIDDSKQTVRYRLLWHAPAVRGVWLRFVLGVTWGNSAASGQVSLAYQGSQVLAPTHVQTLYSYSSGAPEPVYWKFGVYGGGTAPGPRIVDFGWYRVGTSAAAVTP
ncbi:Polysaccharide lyase [Frankineae bacterium MT45]|nr:Polysaccharide lyase [Frankineae bacterium MT45]